EWRGESGARTASGHENVAFLRRRSGFVLVRPSGRWKEISRPRQEDGADPLRNGIAGKRNRPPDDLRGRWPPGLLLSPSEEQAIPRKWWRLRCRGRTRAEGVASRHRLM